MDIMWFLCVKVKFCKASLRIFLHKFVWMSRSLNAKNSYKLSYVEQEIKKLDQKSIMYNVVKLSLYFCF